MAKRSPAKKSVDKPAMPTAPELSPELAKELAKHTKPNAEHKAAQERAAAETSTAAEADTLDDTATNDAVDEIVRHESDVVLATEDAARNPQSPAPRRGFWHSLGHFFAAWWRNKWARYITLLLLFGGLITATVIPESRYFVLNTAGVRSSVSLTVIDNSTQLPLKNVMVNVDGRYGKTDSKGYVQLSDVRLGEQTVIVKRVAFAPQHRQITVGWGNNPLGKFVLRATGAQYKITVKDFIGAGPLEGAEADSDGAVATADKNGVITLTLDTAAVDLLDTATVTVSAPHFRSEQIALRLSKTESAEVTLVPSGRTVFVSKQSGTYDLIAMDLDGRNRSVLLPGSGRENRNISLAVDAAGKYAAVVSTRDDIRGSDGYLLSTLSVVDITTGTVTTLEHAEQIQLIDWSGTRLVYESAMASPSASNPQRFKVISYDYTASSKVQLAAANQFTAVMSAGGIIYYGVSGTDPATKPAFWRVRADGTGRQTVLNQETWSAFRTDYKTLRLQTPDGWYEYQFNGTPQKTTPPSAFQSRLYASSDTHNLWVDNRDGQGVLLDYDTTSAKDSVIHTQPGLSYPVRWLNGGVVIYRVANGQEVADYAVNIGTGQSRKITDVTSTYGYSQTN